MYAGGIRRVGFGESYNKLLPFHISDLSGLTGIHRDVLHDLASVGDLPLPKRDPQISQKRPRNSDESETTSVNVPRASTSTLSDLDTSREVAGSRRVQQYQQQAEVNSSTFTLPMHTDELGRLPLHPFFGFASDEPTTSSAGSGACFPTSFDVLASPSSSVAPVPNHSSMAPSTCGQVSASTLDPTLEALFSMVPPASYEQAITTPTPQRICSPPQSIFPSHNNPHNQGLTSVLSENFENYFANASGSVGASANATEGFPDTLDNNTLAVWSNAPTGFGCVLHVFLIRGPHLF